MPNTWYKVDNVAKVFLATLNRRDPRCFRVSCTLTEPVDPTLLDAALQRTAREFPNFQVTLHRGLFWHYLESTNKKPILEAEDKPPCAALYGPDLKNELLYRVSYYLNRINVEMFHVLSDGNGGMVFLKALVLNYLQLRYPDALRGVTRLEGASAADLTQDSFRQFYTGGNPKPELKRRTVRIHGIHLPYDQTQFFEAHLNTKQVLARSRALGVSLTSYLCALQLCALYKEVPALQRGRPLAIALPVNLRNYFPSETARNFFNSVRVEYVFTGKETPEDVARAFDASLKAELSEDAVRARMDGFEKLEHIPIIKPVPLIIKNWVVGLVTKTQARRVTATFSNMGRIAVPEELSPYIEGFNAFCSTPNLFTVVCSYGDDLVLGSASTYRSTNVLKSFYRSLAAAGLDVTLYATEVYNQ